MCFWFRLFYILSARIYFINIWIECHWPVTKLFVFLCSLVARLSLLCSSLLFRYIVINLWIVRAPWCHRNAHHTQINFCWCAHTATHIHIYKHTTVSHTKSVSAVRGTAIMIIFHSYSVFDVLMDTTDTQTQRSTHQDKGLQTVNERVYIALRWRRRIELKLEKFIERNVFEFIALYLSRSSCHSTGWWERKMRRIARDIDLVIQ